MPPQSGLLSSPARRQASAYSLNAGSTMETQGAPRLLSTRARAWMSSLLPLPKAEAAGGQAVSACRSGKGLLGVGRRVGREARIRPDQRGTEELRRAFGADVYAEIKQGRGIALGHRRHGEKVAAVCIELHKEPRSVVEMGAPPPGRMGIPFFSADSAARIQAAQSSGLVRVVSTTIWLGRGR